MKLRNLFLLLAFAASFTFTSCGDDDSTCTKCKLEVPLLGDCEVEVCEDGSFTDNGATVCATNAFTGSGTQAEVIAGLEALGYDCNQ